MKKLIMVLVLLYICSVAPVYALADYFYVSQMEKLLNSGSYEAANREAMGLRRQHDSMLVKVAPDYGSLSLYRRKLHDLHIRKFNALENCFEAWRHSERSSPRASAENARAHFILAQTNSAIDILLQGGGSYASIARVEDIESRIRKNSLIRSVTSSYLLVGNQQLKRGEPFWVIEVAAGYARIMHMGNGRSAAPITGWIMVSDLERRSNWQFDPTAFDPAAAASVVAGVPRYPVQVVIITGAGFSDWDDPWSRRHDRMRRPHKRAHASEHYPNYQSQRSDRDRHRVQRPPRSRQPHASPPRISQPPRLQKPPALKSPPPLQSPPPLARPQNQPRRPHFQRPPDTVRRPDVQRRPDSSKRPGISKRPANPPQNRRRPDDSSRPGFRKRPRRQ
ncbi:MAG TPA: hypothetical protein DCG57_00315 [Candidatus Riflebacteria bacterium]|nr:hypothetical protein [Candidatus Riflebacteria bacterium]